MSTLPADPWKALGVDKTADKSEIRTAYKKLVLKCHPDKVQDPELKALKQEEFTKVQHAWELLNNDAELAKYEEQLKLAELKAKAQAMMKNAANTSVPRTTSTRYYDIMTAEPPSKYKSNTTSTPTSKKVYTHYASPHTRSHEEVPTSRTYAIYEDGEKTARRAASYEKPSKRDEDKMEDIKRREKEELRRFKEKEEERKKEMLIEKEREKERERERQKERERERERDKEARRAEKKRIERLEKEREKERRRDAEEKSRRHKPYVETYPEFAEQPWAEDEVYMTSRSDKKKPSSGSKKYDDPLLRERERERERERDRDRERERERDKSSSRRAKSPHAAAMEVPERKHIDHFAEAANYIARAGGSAPKETAFWKSQTPPDQFLDSIPVAPTPPPADPEGEMLMRAARRAARRPSHEASKSKEKLKYDIDVSPPKSRPIPNLTKSYTTPPVSSESPPRLSRTNTTPHEYERSAARGERIVPIPSLMRSTTWAPGAAVGGRGDPYDDYYESDDDRERRHRRSRRNRSPEAIHYKVEGGKTSKMSYSYGESPNSSRKYADDGWSPHSPSAAYAQTAFKVKEAKSYGLNDIKYADYMDPYGTAVAS
ncbi:hypothetical protein QBC40DRAFT_31820 [Triangularia verruculosa]|uniref:J domain-containing protein n=1 Tax=Triangularia verruculosa TaxID=2587418 RepID=A0AAN6XLY8_9PEZI|nr:hypothetical protein QBC40DRAFT_31820 [Triangularia verruculosa]